MNRKLFRNLEIAGAVIIILFATFLHFVYDLSQGNVLAAIFGAVNESVWENTKIFIISYLIWAVIEFLCVGMPFKHFVVSKIIGVYFLGIAIITLFYLYNLFTGKPIVVIDIIIGVAVTAMAQYISYRLNNSTCYLRDFFVPSLFFLGMLLIMFFSFSIYPPKMFLFRDYVTGFYGIIPQNADRGAAALNVLYGIKS